MVDLAFHMYVFHICGINQLRVEIIQKNVSVLNIYTDLSFLALFLSKQYNIVIIFIILHIRRNLEEIVCIWEVVTDYLKILHKFI